MKLDKAELKQHDELVKQLGIAEAALELCLDEEELVIQAALTRVKEQVKRYNKVRAQAATFALGIAEEADGRFEDKSERWQESEAGQAHTSFAEEWHNAAAEFGSAIAPPSMLALELDDELVSSDVLKRLPQETES